MGFKPETEIPYKAAFFSDFLCSFLLRTAPHYLNAWNRLQLQKLRL